jgi:hypothetical protein
MYLQLKNLYKKYQNNTVVNNFNIDVEKGELISILGPSGCGKTTTLRMIAGFIAPTSGEIFLSEEKITDYPPEIRPVSTVFQNYALFPHLTAYENIEYGLRYPLKVGKKLDKKEKKERTQKMINLVNLKGLENRRIDQLSGGQQQRVALARSLVLEPKVLLLDEPLSNIDTKLRETVRNEIRKIQKELGITMIFVTHDQEEAMSISDRIIVMNEGNIEQIGTPREIYTFPETVFVAEFIGKANIMEINKKSFIVRPENVNISYNEKDNEKINNSREKDVISGEGKIIGKEYQGSLTSYEIEVTDELFRKEKLNIVMISGKKEYETGQTVKYSIDKSNLYEIKS